MTVTAACPPPLGPRRLLRSGGIALSGVALGLFFGALLVAVVATRLFGYQLLTVRSGSMEPAIAPGDLIVVRPQAMSRLSEGDVVLFASGGEAIPTVHRVIGINEFQLRVANADGSVDSHTDYRLVTQGDANPLPDAQEVSQAQFMGEVWFSVPGLGLFTRLPLQYLFLAFAVVSGVAWCGWEILRPRGAA